VEAVYPISAVSKDRAVDVGFAHRNDNSSDSCFLIPWIVALLHCSS